MIRRQSHRWEFEASTHFFLIRPRAYFSSRQAAELSSSPSTPHDNSLVIDRRTRSITTVPSNAQLMQQLMQRPARQGGERDKWVERREFDALLGVVTIENAAYLVLVTDSTKICSMPSVGGASKDNKDIYTIKAAECIPYRPCPPGMPPGAPSGPAAPASSGPGGLKGGDHAKYVSNIEKLLSSGFYYSYDYDLTHTLQRKRNQELSSAESAPLVEIADERFFWNRWLCQPFLDSKVAPYWLVPIVQGHVKMASLEEGGNRLDLILISRRSCRRGGTRYNARGIDDEGQVANFVETEQLTYINRQRVLSFVQIRGSVPVFWEQTGLAANTTVTRPPYFTYKACKRHQDEIIHHYGEIMYVDLLSGNKLQETRITEALNKQLSHLWCPRPEDGRPPDAPPIPQGEAGNPGGLEAKYKKLLSYTHFDFHQEVKDLGFELALHSLIHSKLTPFLSRSGLYDSDDPSKWQTGVIRTNCLDCLDRTNAVQWYITWSMLAQHLMPIPALQVFVAEETPAGSQQQQQPMAQPQLVGTAMEKMEKAADGLRSNSQMQLEPERVPPLKAMLSSMWAEQGDAISVQYTGTGSILSSVIKQGKSSITTNIEHALRSIGRFYQNNFEDSLRQECIDLLLGRHRISGTRTTRFEDPSMAAYPRDASAPPLPTRPNTSEGTSPIAHGDVLRERHATDHDVIPEDNAPTDGTQHKAAIRRMSTTGGEGAQGRSNAPKPASSSAHHHPGHHPHHHHHTSRGGGASSGPLSGGMSVKDPNRRRLTVWVGSWNLGGKRLDGTIRHWLEPDPGWQPWWESLKDKYGVSAPPIREDDQAEHLPDIFILCIQELIELSGYNVIMGSPDKDREEGIESAVDFILRNLGLRGASGQPLYRRVQSVAMVGLYSVMFAKDALREVLSGFDVGSVKVGFKGSTGNKGAVCIRFVVGATPVCVVNVHLSPGQEKVDERCREFRSILQQAFQSVRSHYSILEHDAIIVAGDFNFRVNMDKDDIRRNMTTEQGIQKCIFHDQLTRARKADEYFRYFREPPLRFGPTYKYIACSTEFDWKRAPAWCDRILFTGKQIRSLTYCRHDLSTSDHRPISALFEVVVRLRPPQYRPQNGVPYHHPPNHSYRYEIPTTAGLRVEGESPRLTVHPPLRAPDVAYNNDGRESSSGPRSVRSAEEARSESESVAESFTLIDLSDSQSPSLCPQPPPPYPSSAPSSPLPSVIHTPSEPPLSSPEWTASEAPSPSVSPDPRPPHDESKTQQASSSSGPPPRPKAASSGKEPAANLTSPGLGRGGKGGLSAPPEWAIVNTSGSQRSVASGSSGEFSSEYELLAAPSRLPSSNSPSQGASSPSSSLRPPPPPPPPPPAQPQPQPAPPAPVRPSAATANPPVAAVRTVQGPLAQQNGPLVPAQPVPASVLAKREEGHSSLVDYLSSSLASLPEDLLSARPREQDLLSGSPYHHRHVSNPLSPLMLAADSVRPTSTVSSHPPVPLPPTRPSPPSSFHHYIDNIHDSRLMATAAPPSAASVPLMGSSPPGQSLWAGGDGRGRAPSPEPAVSHSMGDASLDDVFGAAAAASASVMGGESGQRDGGDVKKQHQQQPPQDDLIDDWWMQDGAKE